MNYCLTIQTQLECVDGKCQREKAYQCGGVSFWTNILQFCVSQINHRLTEVRWKGFLDHAVHLPINAGLLDAQLP